MQEAEKREEAFSASVEAGELTRWMLLQLVVLVLQLLQSRWEAICEEKEGVEIPLFRQQRCKR